MKYAITLLICCAAAFAQAPQAKSSPGRYQLLEVTIPGCVNPDCPMETTAQKHTVLLLDTSSGQVWEYSLGLGAGASNLPIRLWSYFKQVAVDWDGGVERKQQDMAEAALKATAKSNAVQR